MPPRLRPYEPGDYAEWRRMRTALWPEQTESDMQEWLAEPTSVTLVAERQGGGLCGFIEVGERRWAEGCLTSPVAYIEGWWVDADVRRTGVGSALVRAAERWALDRGYSEMGSDVLLDNEPSQRGHERLGFREVERVVAYAKKLG